MIYFLLIVGFICLVKGADFFVDGSSAIARHFDIPAFIIGLTIVAFGTSMPEAAVSVTAALKCANGIAVGNVLGSNIFNLLIVLGFSAAIKACPVSDDMLRSEYPLSIAAAAAVTSLAFISRDGMSLSRIDGIILLGIFAVFMFITVKKASAPQHLPSRTAESGITASPEEEEKPVSRSVMRSLAGIAGIIAGGDLVVDCATDIARSFGISEMLIGLTVVALGTSLPELVTSAVAAVRGETDIAVGNVIGSNLFNLLFVLGISSAIHPIDMTYVSVIDALILMTVSLIVMIPMKRHHMIGRKWGIIMILGYILYLWYIIARSF